MKAVGTIPGILRVLLAVLLIVAVGSACDSGGGMNGGGDNRSPTARLDVSPSEAVVGDTIRLDASNSDDPDGDELNFSWSVTTPEGSDVSISGSGAETHFVADVDGEYDPEVTASDGNGGTDKDSVPVTVMEDSPDEVTVAVETLNENDARIDTADIAFDGSQVGTGFVQKTYEKNADRTLSIEVGGNGLTQADTSVSLGSNHSLEFVLRKEVPKQVTVSFENRAADGDSLIAGDLQLAGELKVSGEKSGSFTTAGSRESKELCAVADEFFRRYCTEVTLTSDQSVELRPERKEVTIATTPVDSTGMILSDAVTFVGSDSVEITGDGSIKRPKRTGERTLVGDWITEEANSSKLNRYRSETITVSAAEDIDREIIIDKLVPACSDKIDNEGDGAADEKEELACSNDNLNYDPTDDNELLKRFSRASGTFFDDSTLVSKKVGERAAKIRSASNPLPWSVTVAKGEIEHRIEVQRSDSISGQMHATHLKTGASNDNLTVEKTSDVVADADTANGFVLIRVHGIDRTFFADGPYYAVYGWHGCKAQNNCGSIDGSGKFYYYAELSDSHLHSWSYVYEPEDVPKNKQQSLSKQARAATLKSGECRQISDTDEISNTVCRVPANKVKAY
jgi:hypothetical protein